MRSQKLGVGVGCWVVSLLQITKLLSSSAMIQTQVYPFKVNALNHYKTFILPEYYFTSFGINPTLPFEESAIKFPVVVN